MPLSIDVPVYGPFNEAEKGISLRWRGARNQRVFFLSKTQDCHKTTSKKS